MSGFRKFRTTLQRRRRSIEALELTHWRPLGPAVPPGPAVPRAPSDADRDTSPLDFSPSLEARQIGPAPIGWLRPRKPDLNH